jgi:hypothetical protein
MQSVKIWQRANTTCSSVYSKGLTGLIWQWILLVGFGMSQLGGVESFNADNELLSLFHLDVWGRDEEIKIELSAVENRTNLQLLEAPIFLRWSKLLMNSVRSFRAENIRNRHFLLIRAKAFATYLTFQVTGYFWQIFQWCRHG